MTVENGSRGIYLVRCPKAVLSGIAAKNMRGPSPAGQCVSFVLSDGALLTNFYCFNEPQIAWTADNVNAWRSSGVVINNGLIDGNNSPNSTAVQME